MRAIHHWIDGKEAPGTSGRTADVYNPATGEVLQTYPTAEPAEVEAAIEAASRAARTWPQQSTVAERAALVRRVAELHTERREMLGGDHVIGHVHGDLDDHRIGRRRHRQVAEREAALLAQAGRQLDETGDAAGAAETVRALMFLTRFRADIDRRLDTLS